MLRSLQVFLLLLLSYLPVCSQTLQQISNAIAFTKIYGYLRFFYPGDEAAGVEWDRLAKFGHYEVNKAVNNEELTKVLNRIFQPVVPTLLISDSEHKKEFDVNLLSRTDSTDLHTIAWQHQGVGYGIIKSIYETARTYRPRINHEGNVYKKDHEYLFNKIPHVREICKKEIIPGIFIQFPLALYGNSDHTFPVGDSVRLKQLQVSISKEKTDSLPVLFSNLADLTIGWNLIQHFYPYFPQTTVNWNNSLETAITQTFNTTDEQKFLNILRIMMAGLKDGHLTVNKLNLIENFLLPVTWEWIGEKLVITKIIDSTTKLRKGMIVDSIDNIAASKYFDSLYQMLPAPTIGYRNYLAQVVSTFGKKGSEVRLSITGTDGRSGSYELTRSFRTTDPNTFYDGHDSIMELSRGTWYINLSTAPMPLIRKNLANLKKAKTIICDLRGYPASNHEFLRYLLKGPDTSSSWMQVPQFIYPDQENIAGWAKASWKTKPLSPHIKAKIIFITDGRAISYAESFLSFVKHYRLGTIIGQHTAGTNGNVNRIHLPGGYFFSFTGMKVLQHNGSTHHGVGIAPDIYLQKTIAGVREGKDEFLEKAIEFSLR